VGLFVFIKIMSGWINNKFIIHKTGMIKKPCNKLGFCPYGQLVEEYPLKEKVDKVSCDVFGHDCPVFYMAEFIKE